MRYSCTGSTGVDFFTRAIHDRDRPARANDSGDPEPVGALCGHRGSDAIGIIANSVTIPLERRRLSLNRGPEKVV
jgi:hypothetical protein